MTNIHSLKQDYLQNRKDQILRLTLNNSHWNNTKKKSNIGCHLFENKKYFRCKITILTNCFAIWFDFHWELWKIENNQWFVTKGTQMTSSKPEYKLWIYVSSKTHLTLTNLQYYIEHFILTMNMLEYYFFIFFSLLVCMPQLTIEMNDQTCSKPN